MPFGILGVPNGPFLLLVTLHSHHTISINELCISYIAIGYTHMDIMQAIIAIVYVYIVMGEFKGQLAHLSSPPGFIPFGRKSRDGVCDNYSVRTIVSGSYFW